MAQLAMLGGMGGGGIMSLLMPLGASVVGMFLQPGQKEEQGKLNDLKVSTSAYGQGIAIVFGTMRVPGNMFWATEFEEVKRYINSKGKDVTNKKKAEKKGQPVYEYYANYAMGLCEGPVGELLRVWADSNLIYDKYNPDNEDLVEIGFSRGDDDGGKMGKGAGTGKKGGSQESGRFRFRFYNGSEEQLPDPHMKRMNEQHNGTPTSAHRGLSYLYFERFALMDFGNRIPTITAEVTVEPHRKPIFTNFLTLEKQGETGEISPGTRPFDQMFFDPIRMRIYTTTPGVGTPTILRVWDIDSRKETKRLYLSDISSESVAQVQHPAFPEFGPYYSGQTKLFNGIGNVNYPTSMEPMECHSLIGISASGDLIGKHLNHQNSVPIIFIDPESMTIKNRFGEYGNQLGNTSVSLQNSRYSTIISYFDPTIKTPFYYTVVIGIFGSYYFFNDENHPMNFWGGLGTSISGQQGLYVSPGLPHGAGTSFYTSQGSVLFGDDVGEVIRWEAHNSLDTQHNQPTIGQSSNMNGAPYKSTVIYRSQKEDDETSRRISQVFPIMGAEAVGFIEFVYGNTAHPEKNGAYAVKVAYGENTAGEYEVLWRQKFSDDTFNMENNACRDSIILTGHRLVYRYNDTLVWEINYTEESVDMWYLPEGAPPFSPTQFYFPIKGSIFQEWRDTPLDASGFAGSSVISEGELDRMVQKKVTVEYILRELADRVGLEQSRIDATKLNDDEITGYVVQQPKAARHVAEDLMKVFFFDMAESDYVLKAVSRSQSVPAGTIYQPDLGFIDGGTSGDNPSDYYKQTIVQEIDLPQTTMVTYIDPKDDYESGEQHWRRPRSPMPVMQSREKLDINLPMALEADFAKQLAQKITYSAWSERSSYEFALPWKFLKYDPTDILVFEMDDGLTIQARMASMDIGADFSMRATGVATEMASYLSTVKAQGNGRVVPIERYKPPFVRAEVFDLPYFEDVDSIGDTGFQYYWGLKAYGPGFRVGALSKKLIPNGTWEGLGMTPFDMPWGTVLGHVPRPPWGSAWPTDDISRIRLMPAFDFTLNPGMYEWSSIPDDEWPSNENTVIINDEIIYFKDFEMNGDGSVTIFNLIRGARGTINAAYSHLTGGSFYLVTSAFQDEIESFENANRRAAFRPSSASLLPGGLPTIEKELTGATHRPWAPNMVKRTNSGGNIVFTWERSTRLGGQLKDGTGTVPQVDGPEEYEVYLLDGPYHPKSFDPNNASTYRRKYGPLSTKTVTYTAAEIAADGLTQTSTLYVVVLQRNQFVGRGFPGWYTSFPGY